MNSVLSILSIVAFMYTIILAIFFFFDKSIRTSEGFYFCLGGLMVVELVVAFCWSGVFLQ